MRPFFKLLLVFLFAVSFASAQKTIVNSGSQSIVPREPNRQVTQILTIPVYSDTTLAIPSGYDSLGMIIFVKTTSKMYKRDTVLTGGHVWTEIGSSVLPFTTTTPGIVTPYGSHDATKALGTDNVFIAVITPGDTTYLHALAAGKRDVTDTTYGHYLATRAGLYKVSDSAFVIINTKLSSASVTKSITGDGTAGNPLQLVNDAATPGANMVYGTDGSGVRGWYNSSTGTTYLPGLNMQSMSDGGQNYLHASNILPSAHNIYVLASGQSNMGFPSNTGPIGDTTTDTRVHIWNWFTNTWVIARSGASPFTADGFTHSGNPAWYFCKALAAATGKDVWLVIHYKPSTSIASWFNGASKGPQMDSLTGKAVASGVSTFNVFLWLQGEQDNALLMNSYLQSYDSVKAYLRRQPYFPPMTPIIVGGMPKVAEGSTTDFSYSDRTLQTVDGNLDQWDGYANTDSATVQSGQIHYDNVGQKVIGQNMFAVYKRLPIPLPASRVHENYLKMFNRDSSGTASEPQQIVMQNNCANGWSGFLINDNTGTTIARMIVGNPSAPSFSGVFGTNSLDLSAEHSVGSINLWTTFGKRIAINSSGLSVFGGYTQTQTGTGLYNNSEYIGEDNAHTWFWGGTASAYNNGNVPKGYMVLYNLSAGALLTMSPNGFARIGAPTTSNTSRLALDANITAANQAGNGILLNTGVGTINDNSTILNATVPYVSVNTVQPDTLNALANGVTYSVAPTLSIAGPPVQTAANHTIITTPLSMDIVKGNSRFGGIAYYTTNLGSSYNTRTLTDKGYVDSVIATIAGYQAIQNAGVSVTQRSRINFPSGSGLTATDNSGNTSTDVTITSIPSAATATTQAVFTNNTTVATTAFATTATKITSNTVTGSGGFTLGSGAYNYLGFIDASGGASTIGISPSVAGQTIVLKRIDNSGNTCTISMASGNIDGSATKTLPALGFMTLYWDGTNAWIINN